MKVSAFTKVHAAKEALYIELFRHNPTTLDDEEVLAELSAFASTLTPRNI